MAVSDLTLSELNNQIAEVSTTINNIVNDDFNYSEALLRQVHLEKCLKDCLKAQALLDTAGTKVSEFYRKTTHEYKTDPQRYAKELRILYNKAKSHNNMRAALSESSPKQANEFEIPHAIEVPKGTWERPEYQRSPAAILFARFKNYSAHKYHKRAHITVHGAKKHLASLRAVLIELDGAEDQRKKRWDVLAANEDAVEAGITIALEKLTQEANHAIWVDAYEGYASHLRQVFHDLEKADEIKVAQTIRPRASFWKRHGKLLSTKASILSLSKSEKRAPLTETAEDLYMIPLPSASKLDIQTQFEGLESPFPTDINEIMRMKCRTAPTIRSIDEFRASQPPLASTTVSQPHPSLLSAFSPLQDCKSEITRTTPSPYFSHLSPFPPAKETTGSLTRRRRNGFEKSHRSFEGYTEQGDESSDIYSDATKNCIPPQEYYDQMFVTNSLALAPPHVPAKAHHRSLSDPMSLPSSLKLSIAKQRAGPSSSVYSPQGSEVDGDSERERMIYNKPPKATYDSCFRPSEPMSYYDNGYDDSDGLAAPVAYSDAGNYSEEMSPLGQAVTPNTPMDNEFYKTEPGINPHVYPRSSVYSSRSQDYVGCVAPLRLPSQPMIVRNL